MSKINVWDVVRDHFQTLRDFNTGRYSRLDVLEFFGLPFLVAGIAFYFGIKFNSDVLLAILTAFSIFAGLLLNLLLLIVNFSDNSRETGMLQSVRKQFLVELHANISFSILISIAIVVFAMFAVIVARRPGHTDGFTGVWSTAAIIYLTTNFVLTLLMVLKRMHTLLAGQFNRPALRRTA